MECHNSEKAKAGFKVETYADLTRVTRKGKLVVPEKPDQSKLVLTLEGKGKAMPPKKAPQPRAEEVTRLRDWVKAGAKDDTPADDKKKLP
jgi:hypothetical protein